MTTVCKLFSEPYGSTGNIGENFRRLLGAPTLDPLQTVLRESIQNIADAAKLGRGPEILIRLRTLTQSQREILGANLLHTLPVEVSSRNVLQRALERQNPVVLEICDFGTSGLGGPTRSDRIPVGTTRTDFIDFLRNIGTPRDKQHGGGTYGFGKVALYRASRCSTIIVDSLVHGSGVKGRRVIGCHVGRAFDVPEDGMMRRFTGRHWWGVADPGDGIVDPVEGFEATDIANALGFPSRDEADRTGTSIMILDFASEGEQLLATGNRIAETILWNFWPRMMQDASETTRFSCRVEVDGAIVRLPDPEQQPPFDLLCKAMRAARNKSGNDVRIVEAQRPVKILGTVAIEKGIRSPRRSMVAENSLVPSVLRHIALMRPVELVVKYLEGSSLPDERLEWAGVFLTSDEDEVERAFAESEPPAHDDWIPANLPKGNSKRYVNIALTRLRGIATDMGVSAAGNSGGAGGDGRGPPLARLAGKLGAILENGYGGAATKGRTRGARGGARPRRARVTRPTFDRLELGESGRIAVFVTEVTQDAGRTGYLLSASVSVAIEGGAGRVDDEVRRPLIISIRRADGGPEAIGSSMHLGGDEGRFELRVLVPEECAVIVDAELRSEHAE